MTQDAICTDSSVRGHVKLWHIDEQSTAITPLFEQHNQIQYTWGHVAARALGLRAQNDRPKYNISAVYFEFENVADRDTVISEAQSFPRTLSRAYYNSFAGARDFLRVPLIIEPTLGTSLNYSELLPVGQNENQLTFFAQTAGTAGSRIGFGNNVNGQNSKIFAAALVATPDINDPTKDVIFARTVFPAGQQIPKDASSQIGITWNIAFT